MPNAKFVGLNPSNHYPDGVNGKTENANPDGYSNTTFSLKNIGKDI